MILTALIGIPILVGLTMLVLRVAWLRQTLLLSTAVLHLGLVSGFWVEDLPLEAWAGFLRLDSAGLVFLTLASGLFTVTSLYGLAYFAHERHPGALPRRLYDGCLL